jgi:glycosyltransferase involved in cell wall biosynthesis
MDADGEKDGSQAMTAKGTSEAFLHPDQHSEHGISSSGARQGGGERPTVSVIIPCRNEARLLGPCLDSVLASTYPKHRIEILIADGRSDDGTREVIARYASSDPRIRLLDNPERIVSTGLNVAIRAASGEFVVRVDAHAVYPPDYIPHLLAALEETGAANVGGCIITLPGAEDVTARAIAVGMSHPLGVGNSRFRVGTSSPTWVDHVAFGCWRRTIFDQFGLFDEELVRGQDVEFNARLIRGGGRVLLLPDVTATYHARRSFRQVARMFYQYGYFKPLVARKAGRVMTARQLVPPLFVLVLGVTGLLSLWWWPAAVGFAVICGCYLTLVLSGAIQAMRRHGFRFGVALLAVFSLMHFSYGIGYLVGIWDHILPFRRAPKPAATVGLSR